MAAFAQKIIPQISQEAMKIVDDIDNNRVRPAPEKTVKELGKETWLALVPVAIYPESYSKNIKENLISMWEGKPGVPKELIEKIKI